MSWYRAQGFSGSPQRLSVDGYEAVRDGRTVYVHAGNVSGSTLHTNIYLISYNQQAGTETVDIFSQILKNWKFNSNISYLGNCENDSGRACRNDSDCAAGDFCDSDKAKIVRDVRRLEIVYDIKSRLQVFYAENQRFPRVNSGSYLPFVTVSVWPSWQTLLAPKLKAGNSLPIDPVNRLGPCGHDRFNSATCWDHLTQEFADPLPANGIFDLPEASRVYAYIGTDNGQSYTFCSFMESGFIQGLDNGVCHGSASLGQIQTVDNNPPRFLGVGSAGGAIRAQACFSYPFSVLLRAADPDGDELTWSIDTAPAAQWSSWSSAPTWTPSAHVSGINLSAASAGNPGQYELRANVSDSRGGSSDLTLNISVESCRPPRIIRVRNSGSGAILYDINTAPTMPFSDQAVIGQNVSWLVEAEDPDGDYPLNFVFRNTPRGFNTGGALQPDVRRYAVEGQIVDYTGDYRGYVYAADTGGYSSDHLPFTITVSNQAPVFSSSPSDSARACVPYSYQLTAADPDGHSFSYQSNSVFPSNLNFSAVTGLLSGYVRQPGNYALSFRVQDEYLAYTRSPYSASSQQGYTLNVGPENFNFTLPTNNVFYNRPGGIPLSRLYHPHQYSELVESDANFGVSWSLDAQNSPAGVSVSISSSGYINATANLPVEASGLSLPMTIQGRNICGEAQSSPFSLTVLPNEWCGDGVVQAGSDEHCDFSADNSCCRGCRWVCPGLDGYNMANLGFTGGPSYVFTNNTTRSFTFPACLRHGTLRATVSKNPSQDRTAVVFVTDTSGSMSGTIGDVRNAIIASLNAFHNASAVSGADLHVGLVRFSSSVTSRQIRNISSTAERDAMISVVNSYGAAGLTYTSSAVSAAHTLLNNYAADRKIIILLSDGAPSGGYDPSAQVAAVKAAGIRLYSIAYNANASLEAAMCAWSSDNGGAAFPCFTNNYSYRGNNAVASYTGIVETILARPVGAITIRVAGVDTIVNMAGNIATNQSINMSGVTCQDNAQTASMRVEFSGPGSVQVSNMRLEFCLLCDVGTSYCGDGVSNYPNSGGFLEDCDGSDLGGLSCLDRGFGGGTLACAHNCRYNESACCTPVYGDWSNWGPWSECSAGCGGGTSTRTRQCNSPAPSCGGLNCVGSATQHQACNTNLCSSCADLLANAPGAPSGAYSIDPDGAGPIAPLDVWCDMDSHGGGWTIIDHNRDNDWRNRFSHWSTYNSHGLSWAGRPQSCASWRQWFDLSAGKNFRISPNCQTVGMEAVYRMTGNYYGCRWYNGNCHFNGTCHLCEDNHNIGILHPGTCPALTGNNPTGHAYNADYAYCYSCVSDWWNSAPSLGIDGRYCVGYR